MNRYVAAIVSFILALLIGAAASADKTDAKLEGKWLVTSVSTNGKKLPEKMVEKLKAYVIFKDGKILRYREEFKAKEEEPDAYKIDISKKPATIDVIDKDGKVKPGIFELNGDNLKIASGDPRPKTFEDAKGVDVLTLKRQK